MVQSSNLFLLLLCLHHPLFLTLSPSYSLSLSHLCSPFFAFVFIPKHLLFGIICSSLFTSLVPLLQAQRSHSFCNQSISLLHLLYSTFFYLICELCVERYQQIHTRHDTRQYFEPSSRSSNSKSNTLYHDIRSHLSLPLHTNPQPYSRIKPNRWTTTK